VKAARQFTAWDAQKKMTRPVGACRTYPEGIKGLSPVFNPGYL
jgi:hypothetical protein